MTPIYADRIETFTLQLEVVYRMACFDKDTEAARKLGGAIAVLKAPADVEPFTTDFINNFIGGKDNGK